MEPALIVHHTRDHKKMVKNVGLTIVKILKLYFLAVNVKIVNLSQEDKIKV